MDLRQANYEGAEPWRTICFDVKQKLTLYGKKFGPNNLVDPGEQPECFKNLTIVETMCIARISTQMHIVKVNNMPFQRAANHMSYTQDISIVNKTLPLLPKDLDIIIMSNDRMLNVTFTANRNTIQACLEHMKKTTLAYQDIEISELHLAAYPLNGGVVDNLRVIYQPLPAELAEPAAEEAGGGG